MTKIVQLSGGTRETQDGYTGPERELTVDISNWGLRLHDGATPGGHSILNRDANDQRYQPASDELAGFEGFEPQQKGLLVRVGPANYKLRRLTADASLVIEDGRGQLSDPLVKLADSIPGDRTFAGSVTFAERITTNDGVAGDTFGTHTGNVIGDLLGDVTGNLDGDASGNHSGTFTGSVDVSGGTLVLADDQVPASAIAGLDSLLNASGVPVGAILMWSGAIVNIPAGYALCDGTNGTPDLRSRFVLGAGGGAAVGEVGGAVSHEHTGTNAAAGTHTHPVQVNDTTLTEAQIPAHKHGCGIAGSTGDTAIPLWGSRAATGSRTVTSDSDPAVLEPYTSEVGGASPHSHTADMTGAGSHTHVIDIDESLHIPPYLALAFIMKL